MKKKRSLLTRAGRTLTLYLSGFIALIFPGSPKAFTPMKAVIISLLLLAGLIVLGLLLRP